MRHDEVGAHLHYSACKAIGIEMTDKQEREIMHSDRCGNTNRQKCHTKGSRKKLKYKGYVYTHNECGT
jgi:hypothetical protein